MVTPPLQQQNSAQKLPISPLFGTDGIRGKAGDLLTASFALQLGLSAGEVLKQNHKLRPIILGQDSRNSSDMLASAIASGLTAAGIEVWSLGICPTPCVAHLTKVNDALAGIMISASHNPPEDNGIKFFGQDGTKISKSLSDEIETQLRKTYGLSHGNPLNNTWGKNYHRSYLIQDYLENLVNTLPKNLNFAGLKVVLDLAWGASVNLAPSVFEQLGAEVIALHNKPDGDKINVNCGSTYLETLKQAVKNHNADLGFAFDGDADRVMAVDSYGRTIDGDYILYLWGKHLQEQEQLPGNLLIGTVMANLGFERAWEKLGGKLIRTAVGDKYVQAEMWRTGAMLGGEQSGHILCHHHSVSGDGLQTALHLTALVSLSGVSLGELVDQSFTTYPQILRNVRLNNRDRLNSWQECQPLQKAISEAEKSLGNDGRVLVRASGTEPLIRVMVEAIDSELTNYWTNKLTREVEKNLLS